MLENNGQHHLMQTDQTVYRIRIICGQDTVIDVRRHREPSSTVTVMCVALLLCRV